MVHSIAKFNKDSNCYESKINLEGVDLQYKPFQCPDRGISCEAHAKTELLVVKMDNFEIEGILLYSCHDASFGTYYCSYRVILNDVKKYRVQYKHGLKSWKKSSKAQFRIQSYSSGPLNLKIYLEVKLNEDPKVKLDFMSMISPEVMSQMNEDLNFTIECNGQNFGFNKTLLSLTSEVFYKMINSLNTKEAQTNSVEINDFSPKTIQSFQKIIHGKEISRRKEFTTELMLLAQKYFIKPLIEKCTKYLKKSLTQENVFDVIKIAHLIDEENLLKNAAKFLLKNLEQMKGSEEWTNFEKTDPDCMVRIYRLMYVDKD